MKTKIIISIIAMVALGVTIRLIAQQQSGKEGQQSESKANDATITAKLEEIVSVRERILQNYETLLRAGRAPANPSPAIELAEARIELARDRGEHERILAEMEGIVVTHEQHLKRLQGLATDHVSTVDIDRARVSLLEAEVRLLRTRSEHDCRPSATDEH